MTGSIKEPVKQKYPCTPRIHPLLMNNHELLQNSNLRSWLQPPAVSVMKATRKQKFSLYSKQMNHSNR